MFVWFSAEHSDLDGGKMFKLVRKLHSKSIKINSEWEEEKQPLFSNLLKSHDFLLIQIRIQTIIKKTTTTTHPLLVFL